MELYYQKPYLTISWDEANNCVFSEWKGFIYGADLRTGLNTALELLTTKQANKALSDSRKLRVVSQEDQAWIAKDWMPRAIKAGLRFSANLVPETDLALASYNNPAIKSGSVLERADFGTLEKAREWLRTR